MKVSVTVVAAQIYFLIFFPPKHSKEDVVSWALNSICRVSCQCKSSTSHRLHSSTHITILFGMWYRSGGNAKKKYQDVLVIKTQTAADVGARGSKHQTQSYVLCRHRTCNSVYFVRTAAVLSKSKKMWFIAVRVDTGSMKPDSQNSGLKRLVPSLSDADLYRCTKTQTMFPTNVPLRWATYLGTCFIATSFILKPKIWHAVQSSWLDWTGCDLSCRLAGCGHTDPLQLKLCARGHISRLRGFNVACMFT